MGEVLQFFNNLFDSVNGYTSKPEAPLRAIIKENSAHHTFWKDAIPYIKAMRYVHPVSKKPLTGYLCLKNWIKTLEAFQYLWRVWKKKGFKQLRPRYINQDPLENFFGCIRSTGCRNINPTCTNFCAAYKILLINNLSSRHTIERNCEDICDGHLLFSLKDFITEASEDDTKNDEVEEEESARIVETPEERNKKNHLRNESAYSALLRKDLLVKAPFKYCAACKATVTDGADLEQTLQTIETLVKKCIT
ncbi:PREDICTED: uncharacterized protein LOC105556783 [Vollenhovia emeryi]|uniref:uncharacterized protein LOC105556783 n=1 Tax=Vollenhovia emeryi TaxID=411798 RepID=UPI0005F512F7|nr:PREDICTED: uncharacterized protein LOC105556783 [Vollenhovia emeryi]